MRKLLLMVAILLPTFSSAEVLTGVFQTAPAASGGFLHVRMGYCEDDISRTCGIIVNAYYEDGTKGVGYEHIGRQIIWDVVDQGNGNWGRGKVWDPEDNKTYDSKMSVNTNSLSVWGCVAVICREVVWQHIQ